MLSSFGIQRFRSLTFVVSHSLSDICWCTMERLPLSNKCGTGIKAFWVECTFNLKCIQYSDSMSVHFRIWPGQHEQHIIRNLQLWWSLNKDAASHSHSFFLWHFMHLVCLHHSLSLYFRFIFLSCSSFSASLTQNITCLSTLTFYSPSPDHSQIKSTAGVQFMCMRACLCGCVQTFSLSLSWILQHRASIPKATLILASWPLQ